MDETYRMLGREHEADLERKAAKRRRAAEARAGPAADAVAPRHRSQKRIHLVLGRVAGLISQQVADRAQTDVESQQSRASYLGSICFPSDHLVLCLFDASSPVAVKHASERLGIPCERVMPAVWIPRLGQEASTRCRR